MSDMATSAVRLLKTGDPDTKLVLLMLAYWAKPYIRGGPESATADGRHFLLPDEDLIAQACEMPVENVRRHVQTLIQAGLIRTEPYLSPHNNQMRELIILPADKQGFRPFDDVSGEHADGGAA